MDKRLIANAQVKKKIEEALFQLMKQKRFSEITVTDIVSTSGVARASYYRNFDSKEDIIESYLERLHNDLVEKTNSSEDKEQFLARDNFKVSLEYYQKHKKNILQLYDNGFGTLILEQINRHSEDVFGDMTINSLERFKIYFISGAMYNTMIQWLKNGDEESLDEMAQIFKETLLNIKI